MRISDWSSDVCSSDIVRREFGKTPNGSTYIINMLDDPGAQETASAEGAAEGGVQEVAAADGRTHAWNGRLIMAYGGGVQANFHSGRSRSEEHTSDLQSLMRISYAVLGLKKKT